MNELLGKYLNGYKIVKTEADPFIKGQINLWTDSEKIGTFGDRSITKFFVRDEGNSNKIYQELVDKENYRLKKQKEEFKNWVVEYRYNKTGSNEDGRYCVAISVTDILNKLNELEGKNE